MNAHQSNFINIRAVLIALGLGISGITASQKFAQAEEFFLYPTTEAPPVVPFAEDTLPDPSPQQDSPTQPKTTYYQTTDAPPMVAPAPTDVLYPEVEVAAGETLSGEIIDEEPAPEHTWYSYPIYWMGINAWDTGIELGINGSTGSNESTSIRTGGYIKRESEFAKIDINAYYNKTKAGGVDTQNNATLNVRNDWYLDKESPWTLFSTGTAFYDQFQAFDLQINANLGVGYKAIDSDRTNLILRVGAGASQELGGMSEAWVPEALFGFDFDHQITKTQKVYAKFDYFPELENFDNYRTVTDVGWEIELIRPSNVSLKISATDRYDSTPAGVDPRLLNYSVLLLWKM